MGKKGWRIWVSVLWIGTLALGYWATVEITDAVDASAVEITEAVSTSTDAVDAVTEVLVDIRRKTTPPPVEVLEDFCSDPLEMNDMYSDMVYDSDLSGIYQQILRSLEFRNQVLAFCGK